MRREQRRQVARLPESSPAPGYETVCVVAVRGRLDMVARNVEILHAGRGAPSMACVLVVSNRRDHEFATSLKHKLPHTFVCVHPNNPLGAKWAAGVAYGRLFDPRGLMILGSDDLASPAYRRYCHEMTAAGSGAAAGPGFLDMLGTWSWYVYDAATRGEPGSALWHLAYRGGEERKSLGAGRWYSRRLLDLLGWRLFDTKREAKLDTFGYEAARKAGARIGRVPPEQGCILSVKGQWEALNPTEIIIRSPKIVCRPADARQRAFLRAQFGQEPEALLAGATGGDETG